MIKYKRKFVNKTYYNSKGTGDNLYFVLSSASNKFFVHKNLRLVFGWNILLFIGTCALFTFLVLFKLVNIQIIQGANYKSLSNSNHTTDIKIRAPRGIIYDRNGVQLTQNIPSYRLMIDLEEVEDIDILTSYVSQQFGVEKFVLQSLVNEKSEEGQKKFVLIDDISKDDAIVILSTINQISGLLVENDVKRYYPYAEYLAHVLGYTGEATEIDLETGEFSAGDIVGKEGIEYQYDRILRGIDGLRKEVIDVAGNTIKDDGGVDPVGGSSVYLSVDIEVQKKMYDLLKEGLEKSGAVGGAGLLADIKSGELLAAVSLPAYDNNLFVGGISSADYDNLLYAEHSPLVNRFIGSPQPPGSTFKTITAIAGLDSGNITTNTLFNSTGVFYLGEYPFQEYQKKSYGQINVIQALAKSSNIFFYETVLKAGIETLSNYASMFGIGSLTGVDLVGETDGNFSDPEYKALITDEIWYPGDSLNAAIGQGYNRVTPVQMLRWIGAIGSGGNLYTPHFLLKYQDVNSDWAFPEFSEMSLNVSSSSLDIVRQGMREGVATGIVYTLRDLKTAVAAKTGTAEFGVKDEKGEYTKTHAWITGFFPYEDPQYVFVFFQEAGGLGSSSGGVAKDFINWFIDYERDSK